MLYARNFRAGDVVTKKCNRLLEQSSSVLLLFERWLGQAGVGAWGRGVEDMLYRSEYRPAKTLRVQRVRAKVRARVRATDHNYSDHEGCEGCRFQTSKLLLISTSD
jgi:hypothetical protein